MLRRTLSLFTLLSCTTLIAHAAEQQPPRLKPPPVARAAGQVDPEMPYFLVCAKACDDCARACEMCVTHCAIMLKKGSKDHFEILRLCQDCAAVCRAAGSITAKDGPMKKLICIACADACKTCGDACAKHEDDAMMKRCAAECRKCEQVCREMAKLPPEGDTPKK